MKSRIYSLNENYFSDINYSSAYIAGFIMADGCIAYKHNQFEPSVLTVSLNPKDIEILEYIKTQLNYSGTILDVTQFDNRTNKNYRRKTLSIVSSRICNDLFTIWNIEPNKTGKESLPKISTEILYSFILGLFDGDGHVCYKNNLLHTSLCSASPILLDQIRSVFNFGYITGFDNMNWGSYCTNNIESYIYRNLVYKNNTFSLTRKRDIFYRKEPNFSLKRRKFTLLDDEIIRKYFAENCHPNFDHLANLLNRPLTSSISNRAVKLGVYQKRKHGHNLTDMEIDFIKTIYTNKEGIIKEIANKLDRPYQTIYGQIRKMGLNKEKF